MSKNPTTHEQRMMMINMYASGLSMKEVAERTNTHTATVSAAIRRMFDLAWQAEGWGNCPTVRQLKRMGMFSETVMCLHRNEKAVEASYGHRSVKKAKRVRVHSKIDGQPAGFFARLGKWLENLAA
jgi:IS30 family transposase